MPKEELSLDVIKQYRVVSVPPSSGTTTLHCLPVHRTVQRGVRLQPPRPPGSRAPMPLPACPLSRRPADDAGHLPYADAAAVAACCCRRVLQDCPRGADKVMVLRDMIFPLVSALHCTGDCTELVTALVTATCIIYPEIGWLGAGGAVWLLAVEFWGVHLFCSTAQIGFTGHVASHPSACISLRAERPCHLPAHAACPCLLPAVPGLQCEKLGQTIIFVRTRETARALHGAVSWRHGRTGSPAGWAAGCCPG